MIKKNLIFILLTTILISCNQKVEKQKISPIKISENNRYFTDENGNPFFWLGDTGWLLFTKLNRDETEKYLENRKQLGFNVIQVMVLHTLTSVNIYGDSALINLNVSMPKVTDGNLFSDSIQYDFWDHVDYVIDMAADKGLYMGLVPVWGSNVKSGKVSIDQAKKYATFLAERYINKPNIIWLNGGDIKGSDSLDVWNTIGTTLNQIDTNHLITFHPRGRMQSSDWFHNENWLDFNMFQSGHRRYDQDDTERCYGEDNWKYVNADYTLIPVKPTLDGEPSYEQIPQGLHDTLQPYWNDNDVRRYAYWSVFAGGCGFTYGHNSVMQFHKSTDKGSAYGSKFMWYDAINHPGAKQMQYLKKLMLSKPYFERIPDQSIIAENTGEKYDYLLATRGKNYAFIYTYKGNNVKVNLGKINGEKVKASWFNPRNGDRKDIGIFPNENTLEFDPPGEVMDGNDWVLILDSL